MVKTGKHRHTPPPQRNTNRSSGKILSEAAVTIDSSKVTLAANRFELRVF